ncbi:unnamed protein product [Phaedon cochleariae]|uniref:Spaetzle domain-containing protein n=1 Tax=Phaedon cochleariae TaxID=80249 RepID=A0A9N9SDQ2_PHACE|nr:unnamed protein product [Phaedon cochleariae]
MNFLDARPQLISSTTEKIAADQPSKFGTQNPGSAHRNVSYRTKERILTHRRKDGSFAGLSEQDIIFPDSFELIFEPLPKIDGAPKCADDSTFCENIDSYPYHHLKDVLQKNTLYKELFGTDEAPVEISNRVGGEDDRYVCGAFERTIFPQVGMNKDNKWKFIINQGEKDGFVQGIRIETCRKPDTPCDIIGDLPNGYVTSCKQKYVYRRLLALNDTGAPVPDSFKIPSSCCCSYKRDFDILARFGSAVKSSGKKIKMEQT